MSSRFWNGFFGDSILRRFGGIYGMASRMGDAIPHDITLV